jgi:hypothetical protein
MRGGRMTSEEARKAGRPVRILRNLRIDDVSSVDVGAGHGVHVVLQKRLAPDDAQIINALVGLSAAEFEQVAKRVPPKAAHLLDEARQIRDGGDGRVSFRHEGGTMRKGKTMGRKMLTCPNCDHHGDAEAFAKADLPEARIAKAQRMVFDSIHKGLMDDDGLTSQQATDIIGKGARPGTHVDAVEALSKAVEQERVARFGEAYRSCRF